MPGIAEARLKDGSLSFGPLRLFLCCLAFLLSGYALLGRGFAYWGVPPIFVGEIVLAVGIVCLVAKGTGTVFRLPLVMPLALFMLWGAVCTLPYIREYQLDALRDATLWGYGAFAFLAAVSLLRSGTLARVPHWYGRAFPWFLALAPLFLLAYWRWGDFLPMFPGSRVALFAPKPGDAAVHYAGIAAFLLLAIPALPRSQIVPPLVRAGYWWFLWLVGVVVVSSGSRGGMVAIVAALLVVLVARPASPRLASLLVAGLTGVGLFVLFGLELELGGPRGVSLDQLATNVGSIFGTQQSEALDNKLWRLRWWTEILHYTVFGDHFWAGKGFGINLADDDGFQVLEESALRSPHSVHITVLARMGVPGLVLWLVLQASFAVALIRAARLARRRGLEAWARLDYWILAYWAAFLVNASFDVYLEGPQGGIWFWSFFGFGLAALAAQRRLIAVEKAPERAAFRRAGGTVALLLACFGTALAVSAPSSSAAEVRLQPGDDIQQAINMHPEGTVFRLTGGTWRRQRLTPKDRQVFLGEDGATLDGAVRLGEWRLEEGLWTADLPRAIPAHGTARAGREAARSPEDLFVDGILLTRVVARADLGPGRWLGENGRAWLTEGPEGRVVELGQAGPAVGGQATDVRLENLLVTRYATRAQQAAIDGGGGRGWRLVDVRAEWNHGVGLRLGEGMVVDRGSFSRNGQLGIIGTGRGERPYDAVVADAEIAGNNYAGFDELWEAGGLKVFGFRGLTLRRNRIHGNAGPGIWVDTDAREILIEDNCVRDNDGIGIQYELSSRGVIRGNKVQRNARNGYRVWLWGAAILVQNSSDTLVEDNEVVVGAGNGIALIHQKRENVRGGESRTAGNRVRGNTVIHAAPSGSSGLVADYQRDLIREWDNLFERNRYAVPPGTAFFTLLDRRFEPSRFAELQALGQERGGIAVAHQQLEMCE